jgi:hypothetical protein
VEWGAKTAVHKLNMYITTTTTTSSRKPEAQPRMAQGQRKIIHFQNISVMEQFVYSIVLLVSQAFLTDPPTTVFLLNMQMASVGLTLVAASHMIMVCSAFMNTLNLVVLATCAA